MITVLRVAALLALLVQATGLLHTRAAYSSRRSFLSMGVALYGSPQTRSPLVNWYLLENKIPFEQKPPRPSGHPFGQIPFLTDDGGVEVFESGAILLYLMDAYGGIDTPQARAKYTKWVVFANSEFESLCFGKKMSGPQLAQSHKSIDYLEKFFASNEYLVDNTFSVADVAVASYLNYIPVFFNYDLSSRPNIVRYMVRCAERPAFAAAFGTEHAQKVVQSGASWLKGGGKKNPFW